jgi:hypothetical protein
MRKRSISAFFYYMMEMVIFLIVLQFLFTISRADFPLMAYMSWLGYVFVTGVLPLSFIKGTAVSESPISAPLDLRRIWLYVHLALMIFSGIFIWEFPFFTLAVLVLIPYWRMVALLKAPVQPALLINRFICFVGLLLFCYVYILATVTVVKTNTTLLKESLPIFMWTQFFILLAGLLWMYYITMKESSGVSFKQWLKGQSLTALIALGLIVIVFIGFLTLPFLQFVVTDLPGIVFTMLASERVFSFIDNITNFFEFKPSAPGGGEVAMDCIECPEKEMQLDETKIENEWIKNLLLPIFQVVVFLGVGGVLYLLIRKLYLVPEKQMEKSEGQHRYATAVQRDKEEKRIKWAKDEVRKLYQSLLVYIQKREEAVKISNTAREWSQRFAHEQPQLWNRINQTYEQKRYSKDPLSAQDIKDYKQEIKQAKKEVSQYYTMLRQRN